MSHNKKYPISLVTGALIALMMGVSGAAMANSDEEQLKRMADPDHQSMGLQALCGNRAEP